MLDIEKGPMQLPLYNSLLVAGFYDLSMHLITCVGKALPLFFFLIHNNYWICMHSHLLDATAEFLSNFCED